MRIVGEKDSLEQVFEGEYLVARNGIVETVFILGVGVRNCIAVIIDNAHRIVREEERQETEWIRMRIERDYIGFVEEER